MNERKHLPLGTVVKIVGSSENYMIVSQFPAVAINQKNGYFDFGGVPLPIGLSSKNVVFFNLDDISEILFVGYIDKEFQGFMARYDELVGSIKYPKHKNIGESK